MCRIISIAILVLIPLGSNAQFQQRASLNLSAGIFSTFGKRTYMPDWGTSEDDREPFQISNYRPGLSASLSFQYNINRHLSLLAEFDYLHTSGWKYTMYEDVDYLNWEIYDTLTDDLLYAGKNILNLTGMTFGLGAKYYLFPGGKFSPFLFAVFDYAILRADYTDTEWQALHELEMLDPEDNVPWNPYLEKNRGPGIKPGIGLEVNFSDRLGIYMNCSYTFIPLKEENFKTPEQVENFHAVNILWGLRISFWKSKEL